MKIQQTTSVDEGVEKREPSGPVGRNVSWCDHFGKHYEDSSKKLKTELPHDPAIPFLGIYSKKTRTLIQKDICIPMFIAALFITAKIWKQPQCLSINEWIKKMWYIHVQWNIN